LKKRSKALEIVRREAGATVARGLPVRSRRVGKAGAEGEVLSGPPPPRARRPRRTRRDRGSTWDRCGGRGSGCGRAFPPGGARAPPSGTSRRSEAKGVRPPRRTGLRTGSAEPAPDVCRAGSGGGRREEGAFPLVPQGRRRDGLARPVSEHGPRSLTRTRAYGRQTRARNEGERPEVPGPGRATALPTGLPRGASESERTR
jgi:hypothetical protein